MQQKTSKLERVDGKPVLKLTSLHHTAVYVPTREEYDRLMRVYEWGGLRWAGGDLPTALKDNRWSGCISADTAGSPINTEGTFGYADRPFYEHELGWKILSVARYLKIQRVTPANLREVEEHFTDRETEVVSV